MAITRKAKTITDKAELDYIFSLSSHDCQKTSVFMDFFGEFDGKRKYNTYDVINVPPNTYMKNKNTFVTTIGSYIFNKAIIEGADLFNELGYINYTINKKALKGIYSKY